MSFRRSISDEEEAVVQAAASSDCTAGQPPPYQTMKTVERSMFHLNTVKAVMTRCSTEFICHNLFVLNNDMCVYITHVYLVT